MKKDSNNKSRRRSVAGSSFRATQSHSSRSRTRAAEESSVRPSSTRQQSSRPDERSRRAAFRLYPQFESVLEPNKNQGYDAYLQRNKRDGDASASGRTSYFDTKKSSDRISDRAVDRASSVSSSRTENAALRSKRNRSRRSLRDTEIQSPSRRSTRASTSRRKKTAGSAYASQNESFDFEEQDYSDSLPSDRGSQSGSARIVSEEVGALRRKERLERAKKKARKRIVLIVAALVLVIGLIAGGLFLFNSNVFEVRHIVFSGADHLSDQEMNQLVNVEDHANLLRIDTTTISARLKQNSWVDEVVVNKAFPDTLEVVVKEKEIAAVVEIPTGASLVNKQWFISTDHMWLMPIPAKDSDAARSISPRIYEDADSIIKISDVPFGTKAEIGKECSDPIVNNALSILTGMTTELSKRIEKISASGIAETVLFLDNGCEIAFGKAEDIRDKERLVLKILEENPDNVSYINVRIPSSPTWRAL